MNSKKVLIIGVIWPEPDSTAAGIRMMQLIQLFLEYGSKITFASVATKSEFSFDLNFLPIDVVKIELNNSSFDEFIKQNNPDIVLFDRFITEEQFGWRVEENCPNAIKILDTEDLHFLREAREKCYKSTIEFENKHLYSELAKRELASIFRCDLTLLVSEFEMELLRNQFSVNEAILFFLPLFYEVSAISKKYSFDEREHFISIGNFHHKPNLETVKILKSSIWNQIRRKLPNAQLHIYGSYCTEFVKQMHNEKEGFIVKERATDIDKIFSEAKVLLAPIPFGAGIKGKLLSSMQFGTPSITTLTGAEGISTQDFWNGFICNNNKDFIEKSIEIYTQKSIWETAQNNGFQILNSKFKKELYSNEFRNIILEIILNLENHRNENFFGQILNYHFTKSTKYMSKWIEEKNKN